MKKKSEKKLQLGKLTVANMNPAKPVKAQLSISVCQENISMSAPICSIDSCRF